MDYFEQADANSDGIVDATEFANFVETQAHLVEDSNKPLTKAQLYHLASRAAIGTSQLNIIRMTCTAFTYNF